MLFIYSTKRRSQQRPDLDFRMKCHYGHRNTYCTIRQQIFVVVVLMLVRKITQRSFFSMWPPAVNCVTDKSTKQSSDQEEAVQGCF